jgi:hypothetical protein
MPEKAGAADAEDEGPPGARPRAPTCPRHERFGALVSVKERQARVTKTSSISVLWRHVSSLNHCQVRARRFHSPDTWIIS